MIYKINKNITINQTINEIMLKNNITQEYVNLCDDASKIFNLLKEQKDSNDIIKFIIKEYKLSKQDSIKTLNQLLYPLITHKFIESINICKVKNKIINTTSCLLEITNVCNFKCPHCYVEKQKYHTLKFTDIKNIANELIKLNCNRISLTGGEVLTHPDFDIIYKYLYSKGFIIGINSNGSLINQNTIKLFEEMPPLSLEISLYGYNEKSYSDFTKSQNNFNNLIKNLKILKEKNINLTLKCVITKNNSLYFNKIMNIAKKLNIPFKSDYITHPIISEKENFNPLQLSPDDTITHLNQIGDVEISRHFLTLFTNPIKRNNLVFKCKKKNDDIFINSQMQVCMCICMQSISYQYKKGNLQNCILNLQKIKNMRFRANSKCKNCKFISICRYCPAKFYLTTHDYQTPPLWYCQFGENIYNTYIKGIRFLTKSAINNNELENAFIIMKTNLLRLGYNVNEEDRKVWIKNIKSQLKNSETKWISIYLNGDLNGFATLFIKNNQITMGELQLSDNLKGTRCIIKLIEYLINQPEFSNFKEIQFSANKKNTLANNTYLHLNAKKIGESQIANKYVLSKVDIENYLTKLIKKS